MSAAESGDDGDARLARRGGAAGQGEGADPAAPPGRPQRSPFAERDADFDAIRDIIAKASRPGAVTADQAAAADRAPAPAGAAPRRPAQRTAPSTAAEAARSVLRASGDPAPVPPTPQPEGQSPRAAAAAPAAGDAAADVVLRQKGRAAPGGGSGAASGGGSGGGRGGGAGRGGPRRRGKGWLAVAAVILVLILAVGAGAWYGTQTGLIPLGLLGTERDKGDLPLVTADAEPIKVRPEDRGGMTIPDQDKQIYERLSGADEQPPAAEKMLAPPETALMEGGPDDKAETLTAAVDGGIAAEAPAVDAAAHAAAPAGQGETLAQAVGAPPEIAEGAAAGADKAAMADGISAPAAMPADTATGKVVAAAPASDTAVKTDMPRVRSDGVENLLPPKPKPKPEPLPAVPAAMPDKAPVAAMTDGKAPTDGTAQGSMTKPQTAPAGADAAIAGSKPPAAGMESLLVDTPDAPDGVDSEGEESAAAPLEAPAETPPEPVAPAKPAPAKAMPPATAALPAGAILLQLAALRDDSAARSEWQRLQARHPQQLAGLTAHYERVQVPDKGMFTRIQAGPFATAAAAEAACAALKSNDQGCFLVRR